MHLIHHSTLPEQSLHRGDFGGYGGGAGADGDEAEVGGAVRWGLGGGGGCHGGFLCGFFEDPLSLCGRLVEYRFLNIEIWLRYRPQLRYF